jgi:hypothetical protein
MESQSAAGLAALTAMANSFGTQLQQQQNGHPQQQHPAGPPSAQVGAAAGTGWRSVVSWLNLSWLCEEADKQSLIARPPAQTGLSSVPVYSFTYIFLPAAILHLI